MNGDVEEGISGGRHRSRSYGGSINCSVRTRRALSWRRLPRGPWVPRRWVPRRLLQGLPPRRLGRGTVLRALRLRGILRFLLSGAAYSNPIWLEASARLRLRLIGNLDLAGPSSGLPGFLARIAADLPLVTKRLLRAKPDRSPVRLLWRLPCCPRFLFSFQPRRSRRSTSISRAGLTVQRRIRTPVLHKAATLKS